MPSAWIEHIPFAFFIIEKLKPKIVVELGVHYGNSFFAFNQAIRELNIQSNTYGVDHWAGDEHAGFYNEDAFNYVQSLNQQHFSEFSTLLRMDFDQAQNYFANGSIDLLHIDGFHTYGAVKHDFETWLPKMSERGIVLLHDTQEMKKDFGVWQLMKELRTNYLCCEFYHGHGLGVVCTGKEVDPEISAFIELCNTDMFIQNLFSTLGRITLAENSWYQNKPQGKELSSRFASLSVGESGSDFERNKVMVHQIKGSICRLEFRLTENQNISRLRFVPINHVARLKLLNIGFFKDNARIKLPCSISSNAVYVDKQEYLFDSDKPFIDIDFPEGFAGGINEIVIDAEYLEEDREAVKLVLKHKDLPDLNMS